IFLAAILLIQIFVWIGCNTAKFGHLYAAAITRPFGHRHLSVLKTRLNIIVACNIPKDSPMLEVYRCLSINSNVNVHLFDIMFSRTLLIFCVDTWFQATAERKLAEKLRSLGYVRPKPGGKSPDQAGF
ncbi:hypothetical protein BHM03_00012524, partial [Ensete ventricosum]